MPLIFYAFSAGAAAGWWFLGDTPETPAESNNQTIRIIVIAVIIIVVLKFLKSK